MKMLCAGCDEQMLLEKAESCDDGTASLVFTCAKCRTGVAMLANAMEAQLVKGLGVHVGGRSAPHKPLEVIKGSLVTERREPGAGKTIEWDSGAEEKLSNIPSFARPMAKAGIERYAAEKGYEKVTVEVMAEARKLYGM